jgi:glycosyltransferase involved in cell wall biosynthesis
LANLGISLEENLGLNYYFALPNKLFDYINHQIPVLVSPFPEMRRIVEDYEIGFIDKSSSAKELADQINSILNLPVSDIEKIQANCQEAREILNWQEEEKILLELYSNN